MPRQSSRGGNDLPLFGHAGCACWLTSLSASFVSVSSVFFSSPSVVSNSCTAWFNPSSAAQVLSVP
jgi:hypothetical protein